MADWGFADSSRFAARGTAAIIGGGTITSPTSLNVKGSWQYLAVVPFDTDIITIDEIRTNVASDRYAIFDIGKGTFGSEQVIFSNLPASNSEGEIRTYQYRFPCALQSGETLCARLQSTVARHVASVGFRFESHGFAHFASGNKVQTYGTSTTTSRLTVVPSGAANVKGSWVQIVGSTSDDISELIIIAGDEEASGLNNGWYLVDIGVGQAGSEKIIIPDLSFVAYSTNSGLNPYLIGPMPVSIPAASRLAMRVQCSETGRDIGFALIGISR